MPIPTAPVQGMYDSVNPGSTSSSLSNARAALLEQRDAGLRVCLNIAALKGSVANTHAYLDYAQSLGMQMILPMHDPRYFDGTDWTGIAPAWRTAKGADSPDELTDGILAELAGHPAVRALYVGDEIDPPLHDACKAHAERVRAAASPFDTPRLFVHMDVFNAASRVAPFTDVADELGLDCYPIQRPSGDYPLAAVGHAAASLGKLCRAVNRGQVMVCQAFSWHKYGGTIERWPTPDEYRVMRDQAATFGEAKMILWWWRPAQRAASDPAQRWADFKAGVLT